MNLLDIKRNLEEYGLVRVDDRYTLCTKEVLMALKPILIDHWLSFAEPKDLDFSNSNFWVITDDTDPKGFDTAGEALEKYTT